MSIYLRSNKGKEKVKELEGLRLNYELARHPSHDQNKSYSKANKETKETHEKIKEILNDLGIMFFIYEDSNGVEYLHVSFYAEETIKSMTRFAGRRKKMFKTGKTEPVSYYGGGGTYESPIYYRYSDIVYMLQTMTNKEIYAKLGMKPATYYRHKKELNESEYVKKLDKNRLQDMEYLTSEELTRLNRHF